MNNNKHNNTVLLLATLVLSVKSMIFDFDFIKTILV